MSHRLEDAVVLPVAEPDEPRIQCAKCPWKRGVDARQIPNGYSVEKHRRLSSTIASGTASLRRDTPMMTCHESGPGAEVVCVGWIVNQIGPGDNLGLRMAVVCGEVDGNVHTVGPQHDRLEDTIPSEDDSHAE